MTRRAIPVADDLGVIPGPGPYFGPFASVLATAGLVPGTVATIHDQYCEDLVPGQ